MIRIVPRLRFRIALEMRGLPRSERRNAATPSKLAANQIGLRANLVPNQFESGVHFSRSEDGKIKNVNGPRDSLMSAKGTIHEESSAVASSDAIPGGSARLGQEESTTPLQAA